jgi:iron complex transport system substrate-binding protein
MRVASVLPSATEIVCALGHRADLVARSAECDYPADVADLPIVMRPRSLDGDRPSGEIDARVRAERAEGESLYTLDVERLRALAPDLLLTQDLCGVCSVTPAEVSAACATAGIAPTVLALTPRRLAEVWGTVETVARALGDPDAGGRLATALRARTTAPSTGSSPARVAVVEWLDPPILAGLWTPDLVRAAGARSIGPAPGEPGTRTTWSAIRDAGPTLVVLSPCSFSVDRARRELADPALAAAVAALAPPAGTYVADEAYFSRPGPRLADGAELLRHLLTGSTGPAPMPVEPLLRGARGVVA